MDILNENVMAVAYPHETVELLLAGAQVIFDEGFFHWNKDEAIKRASAFTNMMEAALGAEKGTLSEMMKVLLNEL